MLKLTCCWQGRLLGQRSFVQWTWHGVAGSPAGWWWLPLAASLKPTISLQFVAVDMPDLPEKKSPIQKCVPQKMSPKRCHDRSSTSLDCTVASFKFYIVSPCFSYIHIDATFIAFSASRLMVSFIDYTLIIPSSLMIFPRACFPAAWAWMMASVHRGCMVACYVFVFKCWSRIWNHETYQLSLVKSCRFVHAALGWYRGR